MRLAKLLAVVLFAALALAGYAQTGYVQTSSFPNVTVADGHSTITVTAMASSATGTPVPDGTQVLFQSDIGEFRDTVVATQNGYARAILVAGTIAGTATIKIKVLGLPIAPQETTVEFVSDRSMLSSAKEYVEIVSPTYLKYSPQEKMIVAEGANRGVSLRYRDVHLEADIAELDISTYLVKAKHATLTIGKSSREFSEISFTLNTRKGHGLTSISEQIVDSLKSAGDIVSAVTHNEDVNAYVDISGQNVASASSPYVASLFQIANFDDLNEPALIAAKKVTVFPNKEVQFIKAELYLGDAKVLKMPLFRAPLNGTNPIFTDQMVNVTDNQLAISYPYYLTLKPGETSFLRFHIGDHTSVFGNANGPQMDYELDWNRGDDMEGGFLLSGIGLPDWGIGFHQFYRFDDRTTGLAQVQVPALRSFYGGLSLSHQFNGFSANANANATETIVGIKEFDQQYSLAADRDPVRIGKLPFRYTVGTTLSEQSTSLPVPIQKQLAYGIDTRLTMDPKRLDHSTTFTMSMTASKLDGINVTKGIGINATLALNRQVSNNASVSFTYDYSQDAYTDEILGAHRLTASANYGFKQLSLQGSASRSIGVDRLDYNLNSYYRLSRLWRVGYSYIFDRALGDTFLDYQAVLYYRVGQREFGIVWSHATKRFGLQVLGATVY